MKPEILPLVSFNFVPTDLSILRQNTLTLLQVAIDIIHWRALLPMHSRLNLLELTLPSQQLLSRLIDLFLHLDFTLP